MQELEIVFEENTFLKVHVDHLIMSSRKSKCGDLRFQEDWFCKYDWLENSISKDATYCFGSCLFKSSSASRFGDGVFTKKEFRSQKRALKHAGE